MATMQALTALSSPARCAPAHRRLPDEGSKLRGQRQEHSLRHTRGRAPSAGGGSHWRAYPAGSDPSSSAMFAW